ncbi:ABC transporter-related protein [Croceitalea dokdonensis DOKDO 023]|uniref:ABC transporter-related protein n=1 Tax=Croceitalea dokdonensis DOKDO 023 TaxID=1300341 RepID=A0A0P7AWB6_9FLAO|nr:ATP-binding cassette domain-containing protein [Croceitalea dokdonensis]KPM30631.1 ABC transporter-related protein [Croceitalea dokdonensis DOKDO 023]
MATLPQITIYRPLETSPDDWVASLMAKNPPEGFHFLHQKKGCVFSMATLDKYIDNEERYGIQPLETPNDQALKTMSSGEQKKALLTHLLQMEPDFMVLVDPYDNLDTISTERLKRYFHELSKTMILIQIISRITAAFHFSTQFYAFHHTLLQPFTSVQELHHYVLSTKNIQAITIPDPLFSPKTLGEELVSFHKVSVSFGNKKVLHQVDWTVKHGEFWHLVGPNGSGKSTLLQMITGDSTKAYGQEIYLFNKQKGTGESVWEIKKHLGYFTASMTTTFRGYDNLIHMLIAGLHDAIGLYVKPTETEIRLAMSWLRTIGLYPKREQQFRQLNEGEKRLLMTARAMIKHPPLLILDEPAIGLDDRYTKLLVDLINTFAEKSKSALIYVSHKQEKGLTPKYRLTLTPTPQGSKAKVG